MSHSKNPGPAELVVLVDEDLRNLHAMAAIVRDLDLRVLELRSPRDALTTVLARRVGVVVVDEALAAREVPGFPDRVRALCGDDAPGIVAMTRSPRDLAPESRHGYDRLLVKPVGVAHLVDAIDDALVLGETRRARAPAAE